MRVFKKLSLKYKTPLQVQKLLKTYQYNKANTILSAEQCHRQKRGHCLEAAFLAAAILEHRGFPPLVVSFESWDGLDHVLYVFKQKGRWGAIGKSRDEGLHGRHPQFKNIRELVKSYFDPYVDGEGRITGYALANLDDIGVNWRSSSRNLWKAERYLCDIKHTKIHMSERAYQKALANYRSDGHKKQASWW